MFTYLAKLIWRLIKSLFKYIARKTEAFISARKKRKEDAKLSPSEREINAHIDRVFLENEELIKYTKSCFGFCPEWGEEYNFEALFVDVIKNYTRYCLALPASEGYHHSVQYGLIDHSLQVANLSLRQAKVFFLPHKFPIDVERLRKKRYHYAAWLCGLLHDAGKLHTDILVTAKDDPNIIWYPTTQTLAAWMMENNIVEYKIKWRRDRLHQKHETASLHFLLNVLTPEAKKYINTCPDDLFMEMSNVLGDYRKTIGYLHTALRMADAVSTASDIQIVWDEKLGARKAAFHEKIIKTLRHMSRQWFRNGKAFCIDDEVYLRWPESFAEVAEELHKIDKTIPNNPHAVRKALADRGVIRDQSENEYCLFFKGEHTSEEAYKFLDSGETKGGIGLLRVEWPSHVMYADLMHENTLGLLKLDLDGNSINYTNAEPEHISLTSLIEYQQDKDAFLLKLRAAAKEQGITSHNEPVQAPNKITDSPEGSTEVEVAEQGVAPHNEQVQADSEESTAQSHTEATAAKEQGVTPHNEPVQADGEESTAQSHTEATAAKEQGVTPHNEPVQADGEENTSQSSTKSEKTAETKGKTSKNIKKRKTKPLKKPVNTNGDLFKPTRLTEEVNTSEKANPPSWYEPAMCDTSIIEPVQSLLLTGQIYAHKGEYHVEIDDVYKQLMGDRHEATLLDEKLIIPKVKLAPNARYIHFLRASFIKLGPRLVDYIKANPSCAANVINEHYEDVLLKRNNVTERVDNPLEVKSTDDTKAQVKPTQQTKEIPVQKSEDKPLEVKSTDDTKAQVKPTQQTKEIPVQKSEDKPLEVKSTDDTKAQVKPTQQTKEIPIQKSEDKPEPPAAPLTELNQVKLLLTDLLKQLNLADDDKASVVNQVNASLNKHYYRVEDGYAVVELEHISEIIYMNVSKHICSELLTELHERSNDNKIRLKL